MTAIRRLGVIALDAVTLVLAILSAMVVATGGLTMQVAGVRFGSGSPARVLIALAGAVLLRLVVAGYANPFGVARERWRRLLPPIDDDPFLVRAPAGAWRRAAFASLGIGLALAILLHDQLWNIYSVPDLGDPLFSMWRIGWVLHQLAADPMHLFDANIFYPEHLTLTLSDPIILPALTEAPLLALGVHPVVAYNLLFMSAFWFSGIATYLLVERLTGSPRAAFIAGLMYACYSYRFEHYSHLELQITQWMPLGLLALHLLLSTGRWPYAVALGLAGVAQLYSSMYYAVFFLVYAAAIGLGLWIIHRPPIRPLVLAMAASMVLAAVMAIPLVRAFSAAQPMKGDRGVDEVMYYSARPIDYLRAQKSSALWADRLLRPAPERALFPGAAPLTLAAIGLAPPLGAVRLAYLAGLFVSVDGSLGLNGWLYPSLYRWLGPVRGIRAPARFAAIVGLTLSILAGFGARRVLGWCRPRALAHAAFVAMIAFIMIDAWPALALTSVWKEPPTIYEPLKGLSGVILAEMPMQPDESLNLPFMYFSLWHWTPMVNGYSGFIPKSYVALESKMAAFPNAETVAALRQRGVTHVTLNCGLNYPNCNEWRERMRFSPFLRLISDSRWLGHTSQLYELGSP